MGLISMEEIMHPIKSGLLLTCLFTAFLAAAPTFAEKPSWSDDDGERHGKSEKHKKQKYEHEDKHERDHDEHAADDTGSRIAHMSGDDNRHCASPAHAVLCRRSDGLFASGSRFCSPLHARASRVVHPVLLLTAVFHDERPYYPPRTRCFCP